MSIEVIVKNPYDDYKPKNLVDGEHVILECSNCGCPLVDLWVVMPHSKITFEYQAGCPHCGDKSFKKTVSGKLHTGYTDYTFFKETKMEDNTVFFEMSKGEKPWT